MAVESSLNKHNLSQVFQLPFALQKGYNPTKKQYRYYNWN